MLGIAPATQAGVEQVAEIGESMEIDLEIQKVDDVDELNRVITKMVSDGVIAELEQGVYSLGSIGSLPERLFRLF